MEDAYVIKKTKVSGWFWVSFFLCILSLFQYTWLQEKERKRGLLSKECTKLWEENHELKKSINKAIELL